ERIACLEQEINRSAGYPLARECNQLELARVQIPKHGDLLQGPDLVLDCHRSPRGFAPAKEQRSSCPKAPVTTQARSARALRVSARAELLKKQTARKIRLLQVLRETALKLRTRSPRRSDARPQAGVNAQRAQVSPPGRRKLLQTPGASRQALAGVRSRRFAWRLRRRRK